MKQAIVLTSVMCACMLAACGEEEMSCAEIEEARVCRPTSEAQTCECNDETLLYDDAGFIVLLNVTNNAHETIDTWASVCDMFGLDMYRADEFMDGPTWSVQFHLVDEPDTIPYYILYGWQIICRWDGDVCTETEQVFFWGVWFDTENEMMQTLVTRYIESIELTEPSESTD